MPKISSPSLPAQASQNGNEMSEMFFNIAKARVRFSGMGVHGISYHRSITIVSGSCEGACMDLVGG